MCLLVHEQACKINWFPAISNAGEYIHISYLLVLWNMNYLFCCDLVNSRPDARYIVDWSVFKYHPNSNKTVYRLDQQCCPGSATSILAESKGNLWRKNK